VMGLSETRASVTACLFGVRRGIVLRDGRRLEFSPVRGLVGGLDAWRRYRRQRRKEP
jgi:hypothetical protein